MVFVAGPDPAHHWRVRVLDTLLTMIAVALLVALTFMTALRPPPRLDYAFAGVAFATAITVACRLARGWPVAVRAAGPALGGLIGALAISAYTGMTPGITIALATLCALLAVWFGRTVALAYLVLAAAGLLLVGWLTRARQVDMHLSMMDPRLMVTWVRAVATFVAFAAALAVVMQRIVATVEAQYAAQQAADAEQRVLGAVLLELARDPTPAGATLDDAWRRLTEAGARGLDVARVSIWLFEDDGNLLRCARLHQRPPAATEACPPLHMRQYPTYVGALSAGRGLAVEHAAVDPSTRELVPDYLGPRGIASMLDAPIRFRERIVGVVCHEHVGAPRPWSRAATSFAASLADLAALAMAEDERQRKQSELGEAYRELGQLHRRLADTQEEERRHLARELHDEMGQVLTALKLRMQLAARAGGGAAGAGDANPLGDAIELTSQLITRVRKLSLDLSPTLLDEAGLLPAVRAYLEAATQGTVEVEFDASSPALAEGAPRLPLALETAAFRVVQESVTNVLRHAAARHIKVSLRRDGDRLLIDVDDDGRGFDPAAPGASTGTGTGADAGTSSSAGTGTGSSGSAHFGLIAMRERVRGLGGSFTLTSRPGAGTHVSASLPVPASPGLSSALGGGVADPAGR